MEKSDIEEKIEEFQVQGLPRKKIWKVLRICKYQGLWYPSAALKPVISFQKHFQANDNDIILVSLPKSGTTWLKALVYSIVNREHHPIDQSPLLTSNPHELVQFFEVHIYGQQENPDLQGLSGPRIFSTHIHYEALPDSILNSKCKIVYLCRNPLDQFISFWHFLEQNLSTAGSQTLSIEDAFELFMEGTVYFGPFWCHMLGYWNASLKNNEKILFLKYEDLKKNTVSCLKKLAEFVKLPFSKVEEEKGRIEEIIKFCSLENLKNLEVNKTGHIGNDFKFHLSSFFRKGEVGDWANHLTPSMADRMYKLMEEKLHGSGLAFEFYSKQATK